MANLDDIQPKVSVIIVNWNGGEILANCVKSVLNSDFSSLEVIIIDKASSDRSIETLEGLYKCDPRIHFIRLSRNVGFASIAVPHVMEHSGHIFFIKGGARSKRYLIKTCVRNVVNLPGE